MERRNSDRKATRVALEARALGRTISTQLHDLSRTGCRIDCATLLFSRGDRIAFKFNDQTTVTAKVAWRRGTVAGDSVLFRVAAHHHPILPRRAHLPRCRGEPSDWFRR